MRSGSHAKTVAQRYLQCESTTHSHTESRHCVGFGVDVAHGAAGFDLWYERCGAN